jgi:N-carbamoyl-L-amino-acid hydrolase
VALATRDRAGTTVQDALDRIHERGNSLDLDVAAYVEIHVQQGRSMEEEAVTIGLVEATWAARKFEFEVVGEQAHTGSCVMADRRDALFGAAMLVVGAREIADQYPTGELHTSVGELDVYPNSPVVVASRVTLLLDLRSPDIDVLEGATAELSDSISAIEECARVKINQISQHSWNVDPYHPQGIKLARAVAEGLGLPHTEVMTLAGHDSTNMKDVAPTVMLFVPSVQGVSHNVRELTEDADLLAGLDMLHGVLARVADGELGDADRQSANA